jgi:hypothetical protein
VTATRSSTPAARRHIATLASGYLLTAAGLGGVAARLGGGPGDAVCAGRPMTPDDLCEIYWGSEVVDTYTYAEALDPARTLHTPWLFGTGLLLAGFLAVFFGAAAHAGRRRPETMRFLAGLCVWAVLPLLLAAATLWGLALRDFGGLFASDTWLSATPLGAVGLLVLGVGGVVGMRLVLHHDARRPSAHLMTETNYLEFRPSGIPPRSAHSAERWYHVEDPKGAEYLDGARPTAASEHPLPESGETLFRRAVSFHRWTREHAADLASGDPHRLGALRRAGNEAAYCYGRLVDAGDLRAANNLAVLLLDRSPTAAAGLLRRAAQAGVVAAMFNHGLLLERTGRPVRARRWYRRAAEAGEAKAMNNLAVGCYEAHELTQARRWFRRAAEAGNATAAANLRILEAERRTA